MKSPHFVRGSLVRAAFNLTGPPSTSTLHAANANYSVEYWAFQGQIRSDRRPNP